MKKLTSSVIKKVLVDWLDHVEVHLLAWGFHWVFKLFLFPVIFVPALTSSVAFFRLWMICSHSDYERVLILGILLGFIKYALSLIFSVYFLFNFRVVILSFGLLQVHPQVVKLLWCRCHIYKSKLFFIFFKKVVRSSIFQKMTWEFIFVFTAWRFDWEVASFFPLNQLDVLVFNVNYGWFLVFTKEVILLFVLNPAKRLHWTIVKIYWT